MGKVIDIKPKKEIDWDWVDKMVNKEIEALEDKKKSDAKSA